MEMVGSTWRKREIHLHAPEIAKIGNNYGDVDLDQFCQTFIERDWGAVGSITFRWIYHSVLKGR